MTGYDIYKQACTLIECEAQNTESAKATALTCLNNIISDLGVCKTVETLETKVETTGTNTFIIAFGVAMLLAQIRLDTLRAGWMAEVYNQKRAQVKSEIKHRGESFPSIIA